MCKREEQSKINKERFSGETKWLIGGVVPIEKVKTIWEKPFTNNKKFKNYIIAYIDFLGIKEKMRSDDSYEALQIFELLLAGINGTSNYISEMNDIGNYSIKFFSDNLIIAQELDSEKASDQIVSIINLIANIQVQALLHFGFLLRGGVTAGELFIDNSVVWGTGLIDAYNLENIVANYPRVIISDVIIKIFENCQKESLNLYSFISLDIDGLWYIDFLTATPNFKLLPEISDVLSELKADYENKNEKVKQKFNWVLSYFNSQCNKFKDLGYCDKCILPLI